MGIEVGEYIRTNDGIIAKAKKKANYIVELETATGETKHYITEEISKHSKNIVDLLEVGDIVVFPDTPHDHYFYMFGYEMMQATKEDVRNGCKIKSVLTHEQYEENCFRLEE